MTQGTSSVTVKTTLPSVPSLVVTASSELMQNHQAALPVGPQQELMAVYDSNGNPIVLSFSPDGDFYAILSDPGSPTGWQQIDLSSSLKTFGTAKSFAVGQLPGGNIFLAVAVQDAADPTTDDMFIAGPLSSDLKQTDWTKLAPLWTKSPNKLKGTTIDRVYVGPVDDGQGLGLPMIAVSINSPTPGAVTDYIVQGSVSGDAIAWSWTDFPTPTQSVKVLDYALGSIAGLGAGVYILYEGAGNQNWLVFKTFLNQYARGYDRQLTVPSGAAALQTAPGTQGTTSLFVGGTDGVFWFSPDNQATGATAVNIASQDAVPDVMADGLIVRQDQVEGGTIAVWALSGENLYYLHGTSDGGWSTPLLFCQGVARIAPLRNQQRYANELVYIGTDVDTTPNVYYMWQDPTTTLWKQDHIPLQSTDQILQFNSYTTRLLFCDANGNPVLNQTFNISASSWLRVVINGTSHILAPDTAVEIEPDLRGTITIINKVGDLGAPHLQIGAAFFTGTLDIDPASKVRETLGAVTSASDIPVLPTTLPSGVSGDDVASAVQGLMQFHPQSGQPASAIDYRPASAPAPRPLNTQGRAAQSFAMSFAGGGFKYHDAASIAAHPQLMATASSAGDTLKDLGGDILEFLKTVKDKVEHFVVTVEQDVVTFIAKIGEDIAQFVVTTFDEVYKAISWLFDKIKVAFDDLVKWLGFLFDWSDIVTTHKVVVNLGNQLFDYVESRMGAAEQGITTFFDKLEAQVKAMEPLGQVGATNIKDQATSAGSRAPASAQQGYHFATRGPGGDYAGYHMLHGGILNGMPTPVQAASAAFTDFINDVVMPTLASVEDTARQLFTDIKNGFESGALTLNQLIEKLAGDVLIGIIDAIKTVAVGMVKFFGELVQIVQSVVNDEVQIPFITALYEKYVGSKMSVLDGLALLISIPATVAFKLIAGKAPFADGTYGLETSTYQQLQHEFDPVPAPQATSFGRAAPPSESMVMAGSTLPRSGSPPSQGAIRYSQIGGIVAPIATAIYDILTLIVAAQAAQNNQNGIKKCSWAQIVLALIIFGMSYPVAQGPARAWAVASWLWSLVDIVKSFVGIMVPASNVQTGVGVFEFLEAFVDIVFSIVIVDLLWQAAATGDEKAMALVGWAADFAGALAIGGDGTTRVGQGDELVYWAGAAVAVGGTLAALIGEIVLTGEQIAEDLPHR